MADENDDLEYSETNVGSAQAQGVRKHISLKLKSKGRGRGRRTSKARRTSTKRTVSGGADEDDVEEPPNPPTDKSTTDKQFSDSKLDEVISKLETPAFNPMDRTFPEPLHQNKKLRWDHKVNLIGEKVIDPLIHCCEKCLLPILNYGRLIACKHVFCYDCAKKSDKCFKCDEKVTRVEQSTLGTVFMCNFGGTRHVPGNCGRTYLSQRDLQAHINHRHLKPASASSNSSSAPAAGHTVPVSNPVTIGPSHVPVTRDPRDPRGHLHVDVSHQTMIVGHIPHSQDHREQADHSRNANIPMGSPVGQLRQYPHSPASYQTSIPVSRLDQARPNLITVPIQDDSAGHSTAASVPHIHPPSHAPQYTSTATPPHPMPALQHPPSNYTTHTYQHPHPNSAPTYSQAPPLTTQTFSQPPPPVLHQPQIHAPSGPIYSTPPPVHHPPPATYTPPRPPHQHAQRPMPPQQPFPPTSATYEENPAYIPQWGTTVPPPPARTALAPRPIAAPPPNANPNVTHIQPRGPSDPSYRPLYYQ